MLAGPRRSATSFTATVRRTVPIVTSIVSPARTTFDGFTRSPLTCTRPPRTAAVPAPRDRLHGTAFVLVVAVQQVLAYEHRVRSLTGDAELAKARERFDRVGPNAKDLRDLVAHLDEYAVGEGRRQSGDQPTITDKHPSVLIYWGESGGGTTLSLAGPKS